MDVGRKSVVTTVMGPLARSHMGDINSWNQTVFFTVSIKTFDLKLHHFALGGFKLKLKWASEFVMSSTN